MYKESETSDGKCLVALTCERKRCLERISVEAANHEAAQKELYRMGWRLDGGKQVCPACLHFSRESRMDLPINWRERAERAEYALRELMALIDKGELVRDTTHDHEPGWAVRQIPFVMALKDAQNVIDRVGEVKTNA